MAITRHNILNDAAARQNYTRGVNLLKQDFTGPTTTDFGIPGAPQSLSTYDLFVIWHVVAMGTMTPPPPASNPGSRNAAHRGPIFLPWHRFMLWQFELNLQRVLNDNTFGLPYWDWAADGQLSSAQQKASPIWAANCMGGSGSPVSSGPFAFNANDPSSFRVRIETGASGQLRQADRGLRRSLGTAPSLPKKAATAAALATTLYDASPWHVGSGGFRNQLEGWTVATAGLHNLVHVWVGGDMNPSTSPNDPVFYLNHCNVDRVWEAWMQQHGRTYLPLDTAPASLKGHRLNDDLVSLISAPTKPSALLNVSEAYVYDHLNI